MPSAFSHAIASIAISKASFIKPTGWKFWLTGAICAAIPDIDAIGFWCGVPYDSMWGHRGITHSFFFAFLLAFLVMLTVYRTEKMFSRRWVALYLCFFACTASHGLLDAMTSGGKGVAFFAPFHNERYFFSFRPILVSPISVTRFFSERGWRVIQSEFVWVWIPTFVVYGVCALIERLRAK